MNSPQRNSQRRLRPEAAYSSATRWCCALVGFGFLASLGGCANRGHHDAYRMKMANEIRVLEDQLYDADYQNRVLRDELERSRNGLNPPEREEPNPFHDDVPSAVPADAGSVPPPVINGDESEAAELPAPLKDPPADENLESIPVPVPDPSIDEAAEPVPPSPADTEVPLINPGEPAPPSENDEPPGKIPIQGNSNVLEFEAPLEYQSPTIQPAPVPDHLELHPSLSGGHQFDSDNDIDGLYLVVTVADENGKAMSLDDFDVDAELTIVVIDPSDSSEDTRVGRWDFSPKEVRQFVRATPVDGIHVPIAWQDREPTGNDVIVHVRLAAADEEMRCQGKLKLEESVAISNWLPRG